MPGWTSSGQPRIYLDNAATTPCAPQVVEAMLPYFTQVYGNASSVHTWGREAKRAVEAARRQVQKALNAAQPQEMVDILLGQRESEGRSGCALRFRDDLQLLRLGGEQTELAVRLRAGVLV